MKKSTPILLLVTVLLTVSLACTVSGVPAPTQDINALGTAIMQTMIVAATQTSAAGFPVAIEDTVTPALVSPTFTPSLTPSATLSPTPAFTSTPAIPLISVSVPTNCRVGPGKVYDRVGALLIGQTAEVVGRNLTGNYWYIRNPNQSNRFCWLWGEYASVTGNFGVLPVFTPPPTPTPIPDFEADYGGLETCAGWWVDLKLTNTGGVSFESVSVTVRDTETDIVVSMYTDVFHDIDGCTDTFTKDRLNPGDSQTVSTAAFTYNPTGHELRATVTLCSWDGQNGMCITESIKLTP
jgi:hypothetical protein